MLSSSRHLQHIYVAFKWYNLRKSKASAELPTARAGWWLPKYKETIHIKGDYFYGKACERRQRIYPRLSTSFEWFWHHVTAVGYRQLLWWGFWGRSRAHESEIKKLQSSVCLSELTPQLHSTFLLLFIRWRGLFLHFLLVFSGSLLQNECCQAADWTAFLICPLFQDVIDSIG